ncbi:hypothetical protein M0802_008889 [Mischocyttarus mexicanus]|nr:hypothetical protein M0802_008889 [Mischocyttarus mexicanus]
MQGAAGIGPRSCRNWRFSCGGGDASDSSCGGRTARSRYDPAERAPISGRAQRVVEPTLSRALCPVLVGISGALTGPQRPTPDRIALHTSGIGISTSTNNNEFKPSKPCQCSFTRIFLSPHYYCRRKPQMLLSSSRFTRLAKGGL